MEYLLGIFAVTVTTCGSMFIIWLLDRFEKEPIWLLSLVFLWGAVPAIIASLILEMVFGIPLQAIFAPETADVFMGSVVAPLVEESTKAAALLVVFFLLRKQFDDVLDGIVFGAAIGAGFAWIEDIFYICGAFSKGGMEAMGMVYFLRVFVFGLNHAFFTGLIGLGFGLARISRNCFLGGLAVVFFFCLGIGTHFLHNTLVGVGGEEGLLVSVVWHWMGLFGLFVIIVITWLVEWRWIKNELREEVQLGHIGERDFKQVSKWFGRLGWELRFLAAFDFAGFFRVRKLFNLLVKLAFLKRNNGRKPSERDTRRIGELRAEVAALRRKFA